VEDMKEEIIEKAEKMTESVMSVIKEAILQEIVNTNEKEDHIIAEVAVKVEAEAEEERVEVEAEVEKEREKEAEQIRKEEEKKQKRN